MRELKRSNRTIYFLLFAVMAVIIDVFVVAGWAFSLRYFIASIYWLVKWRYHPKSGFGFKSAIGCSVFLITTLSGFAVTKFVETDFMQFAVNLGSQYPRDKFELVELGKQRLAFVTRKSFFSYLNFEGSASAKLWVFPYTLVHYNFNTQQYYWD